MIVDKPWGQVVTYALNQPSSVRVITVEPGQETSVHYHRMRDETWVVLDPGLTIQIGEPAVDAQPGEEFVVPAEQTHRIRCTRVRPGPDPRGRLRLHHRGRHAAPPGRLRAPPRARLVRRVESRRRRPYTLRTCSAVIRRAPAGSGASFSKGVMRGLDRPTLERQDPVSPGAPGRRRRRADRGGRDPGSDPTGHASWTWISSRLRRRRIRRCAGSWTTASSSTSETSARRKPGRSSPAPSSRRSSSAPRSTRTTTARRRGTSSGSSGAGTR